MGFLGKFFRKKGEESEPEIEGPSLRWEEIPGTLDLGWYWSEEREEFQMAKIKEEDRAIHFYVIGASGAGKTKFLEFLIQQDIEKGNGFGVIDPHGDLIEDIKGLLAQHYWRKGDEGIFDRVVILDPTDPEFTVAFNPLEELPGVSPSEQVAELVGSFKKIWSDSWGVRMEDLLRNSLTALAEAGLTLVDLPHFLTSREFRKSVLARVTHPITKDYFLRFDSMTDRAQITWIEPVMNKINAFLADERIREIFSSPKSTFNLREIMDNRKILLVKLDKGKLKGSADLLGSLILAKIQMAAFSRSDIPPQKRVPFYLYIDEFQNFASESFTILLSEARKYGLSLIMAHQTLEQIPEDLRAIILGNTGIQVYFRVNRKDAQLLAKEAFEYSGYNLKELTLWGHRYWSLGEEWEKYTEALQSLPPRHCYVKHKIAGGVILIQTAEIPPAPKALGMDELKYQSFLGSLPFGRKYLIRRSELKKEVFVKEVAIEAKEESKGIELKLSPEERRFLEFLAGNLGMPKSEVYQALELSVRKGEEIRESLKEKGLIEEVEIKLTKRGRPAKLLIPNASGMEAIGLRLEGRGGPIHKALQRMILEEAKALGYRAECEYGLPNGGIVDVHLERGNERVAIEICVSDPIDNEIEHILNCLDAGYSKVYSVFLDEGIIEKAQAKLKERLQDKENVQGKVFIVPLSEVFSIP
jgi:hypothetical protein